MGFFSFFRGKRGQDEPVGTMPELAVNTVMVMSGLRQMATETGRPLPLIGEKPFKTQLKILGGVWIVAVVFSLVPLLWYGVSLYILKQQTGISTEMQMLTQKIEKNARQAVYGNPAAFEQLKENDRRFSALIKILMAGEGGVPASPDALQPLLRDINGQWTGMRKDTGLILAQEKNLILVNNSVAGINATNKPLLEKAEAAVARLEQTGAGAQEVAAAGLLRMMSERIVKNANALLSRPVVNPEDALLLGKNIGAIHGILSGLLNGSEELHLSAVKDPGARKALEDFNETFGGFAAHDDKILGDVNGLVEAKNAQQALFKAGDRLLDTVHQLTDGYNKNVSNGWLEAVLTLVFAGFALLFAALFVKVLLDDAKRRAALSEQENRRNQEAILRLLDEMGNLAEGDLTVRARVTEDITGAIADSINYAIDELRALVEGVNKVTEQVTRASREAQITSEHLLRASEKQSGEIGETSAAVRQMVDSINEVSASSAESAKVAQQSLQAAEKGAAAVQNSIAGMNEIRGQIQETAKRIKRLGENSQEISEIVELISDITEQTNILALNAAIQAASAGEAGRGFSVVAEEVQRLAERSAEATRQIGAIVKIIQTDTHDAVAAMEQSTQGVVEGARLSDAAGQTLSEIEQVSRNLADLIETISQATQAQAQAAGKVARNMQGIQDITNQTTDGTKQTASSVGQMTALATELRDSVAGFKLS